MPKIYGLILAGGNSSRMGHDKAFLNFKNKSFLVNGIQILKSSLHNNSEIFVSGNRNCENSIKDIIPHCGPLGGIYSVFQNTFSDTENNFFLILPIDMPKIEYEDLIQLVNKVSNDYEFIGFLNYEMPFILKNSKKLLMHLELLLKGESTTNHSIKSLKSILKGLVLPFKGKDSHFQNINTPINYENLKCT